MPRAPRSAKARTLTPELITAWSTLLDRAEALRALAPWKVIAGDSLLGVRDTRSRETDWCSVMGQAGECFGVAIYQGPRGLGSLQRLLRDGPDPFDATIQQVAAVLTFADRDMLSTEMAAVLKACGRRYRGADAWPELVLHDPGYAPMPPMTVDGLHRITIVIECLLGMTLEARKTQGWAQHDAQDRPWVALTEPSGMTTMVREALPVMPDPPLPVVAVDEVAVGRIRAKGMRARVTVLLDWFVGNAVIDEPEAAGRPYLVVHVVAIETGTAKVVGMGICQLAEAWPTLARMLVSVSADGAPELVLVRRSEAAEVLEPLAAALGVRLEHDPETASMVEELRDHLEGMGA